MRTARTLLLLCLLVGLGAIFFAAQANLEARRHSLRSGLEQIRRAELKVQAREAYEEIAELLPRARVLARYDAGGRLLRPAPPATARAWEPPVDSETAAFLRAGLFEEAWNRAKDSRDRAAVLLARGIREGDTESLERALDEEALQGTDMHYRARLAAIGEPDADWIDDVSALLGGPSERLGRALLKDAEVEPVGDRVVRHRLAALSPLPGVVSFELAGDEIIGHAQPEGEQLVLRFELLEDLPGVVLLDPNARTELYAALPEPYDMLGVTGSISHGQLQGEYANERTRILLLHGGAALLLLVGTIYAFIAMGRAARLAQAKSDFVANVTHELRTPLANIRLYTESLREGRVRDEDRDEFLGTILDESGRLEALVEGLLHAARGPKLEMTAVDCTKLLQDTQANWKPRLAKEGFELNVTAPDLPPVRADKEALRRALDNLIDNARKYGANDRRIEVSGEARNGHVRLSVRDHGPGIPVGERDKVLRAFHRLESADRKETPGTGLGLSLVVATMEAHGGRVEIGGGTGDGALVTLVLPMERSP